MLTSPFRLASIAALIVGMSVSTVTGADLNFNRDILPILSDTCFKCHGPDEAERKADLRLDTREGLFRSSDDFQVVVPNHPAKSELYRRLTSEDPDERMPPPDSKRELSEHQVASIRRWIGRWVRAPC